MSLMRGGADADKLQTERRLPTSLMVCKQVVATPEVSHDRVLREDEL